MSLAAAAWCVICGQPPDVAVTLERRGTLMHYGSCWDHVPEIAARARADANRIDLEDQRRRARSFDLEPRLEVDLDWHDDVYPPELER